MRRKTLAILLVLLLSTFSLCITGCGNQGKKNLELAKENQIEYLKRVQQNTMQKAVESSKALSVIEKASESGSFLFENADEDIKLTLYTDNGRLALHGGTKEENIKAWFDKEKLYFDLTGIPDIAANSRGVYMIVVETFLQSVKDFAEDDAEMAKYIEELLDRLNKGFEVSDDSDKIIEKVLNCFDISVNEEKVNVGGEETDCIVCKYTFKDTALHDLVKIAYENMDLSQMWGDFPGYDYPQDDDDDIVWDDDWDIEPVYPEYPFSFPKTADDMIALLDEMKVSLSGSVTSYVIKESCVSAKEVVSLDLKYKNEMYYHGFYNNIVADESDLNSIKLDAVVNYPKNMSFTESASIEMKVDYSGVSMKLGINWDTKIENNVFTGELSFNIPKAIVPATPKFVVTYDINTKDYSALIIKPNTMLTIPEEDEMNLDVKIMGKLDIGDKYVKLTIDKIAEMDGDDEYRSNDFNINMRVDVGAKMPDFPTDAKEIKTLEELQLIFSGEQE